MVVHQNDMVFQFLVQLYLNMFSISREGGGEGRGARGGKEEKRKKSYIFIAIGLVYD